MNIEGETHTGEKPLECNICSNKFSTKGSLKRQPIHTGEKPFKCDICDRKFPDNSTLNVLLAQK